MRSLVDGRGLDCSANLKNDAEDKPLMVVISIPHFREKKVENMLRYDGCVQRILRLMVKIERREENRKFRADVSQTITWNHQFYVHLVQLKDLTLKDPKRLC